MYCYEELFNIVMPYSTVWLNILQCNIRLRKTYPNKITGVSIMGYSEEDWSYLAAAAEGAGAHILELNFSCPQMARPDAGHFVGQNFSLIEKYTAAAKRAVSIPVIAKMTPNITDMVSMLC